MKLSHIAALAGALALAGAAVPAFAHHSFPATYHTDKVETIQGEVVQFLYRNPHSFIQVMATGKDGKVHRYACEWGGGAALGKDGSVNPSTLKPGDKVVIKGNPGRVEEDYRIRVQQVDRPRDGWHWGGTFD